MLLHNMGFNTLTLYTFTSASQMSSVFPYRGDKMSAMHAGWADFLYVTVYFPHRRFSINQ